jgi:hypothetical protein
VHVLTAHTYTLQSTNTIFLTQGNNPTWCLICHWPCTNLPDYTRAQSLIQVFFLYWAKAITEYFLVHTSVEISLITSSVTHSQVTHLLTTVHWVKKDIYAKPCIKCALLNYSLMMLSCISTLKNSLSMRCRNAVSAVHTHSL